MTEKATTVKITGKVGYESEVTPAQAAQIIAFLESADVSQGLGPEVSLGAPLAASTGRRANKVESAREALEVSGATKNPEKIVALGAYVMQDGGDSFKLEDVKSAFRRARETAPANFTRDLGLAVAAGWLGEDAGGEYYLTNKMEGILEGGFTFPKAGNGSRSRSATRKATSAPKAKNSKPEVFAGIDVFPTTMEGFPPYAKMKQNKNKLLWVVKFAKDNGITGLANKDIEWITDHLGAGVPNKQITAAYTSARNRNYANKSTQDSTIRITPDGEAYLATVGASTEG